MKMYQTLIEDYDTNTTKVYYTSIEHLVRYHKTVEDQVFRHSKNTYHIHHIITIHRQ